MHTNYNEYLSPLENLKEFPDYKFLAFDTETTGRENKFYMGSMFDGMDMKVFYDKEKMKEYLLSRKYRNWFLVATNIMFDLSSLYYPYDENFEILMLSGKIITAKYKINKYTDSKGNEKYRDNYTFIDTLNFAPLGVKNMGDVIGLPKLETPKCLCRIPENENEQKELENYNIRDTLITYKFTDMFLRAMYNLGGRFHPTIAGCSMDIFRRKYQMNKLKKPDLDLLLKMHDGYFGGRVEVFNFGYSDKKVNYYDINSLYPYVMLNEFPDTNSIRYSNHPTVDLIKYEGISQVKINCPDMFYPYLPVRQNKKVYFPTGNFVGVYTHYELRKALELGYEIQKIYWTVYYLKTEKTFEHFVTDLYNKRLQYKAEKSPMEYVVKILMNSGYGRFGLNINDDHVGVLHKWNGQTDDINLPEGCILYDDYYIKSIKNLDKIPNYANPILSIYVTAYARTVLYNYILKYEPFYVDTDSIVTEKEIETSKKLGDMKLEFKINQSWFLYPKAYRIIGKDFDIIKWKGIPHNVVKEFWENGFTVKIEKMIKLKEGIRRNISPNTVIDMTKSLREIEHKRIPLKEIDFMVDNCITKPREINISENAQTI